MLLHKIYHSLNDKNHNNKNNDDDDTNQKNSSNHTNFIIENNDNIINVNPYTINNTKNSSTLDKEITKAEIDNNNNNNNKDMKNNNKDNINDDKNYSLITKIEKKYDFLNTDFSLYRLKIENKQYLQKYTTKFVRFLYNLKNFFLLI